MNFVGVINIYSFFSIKYYFINFNKPDKYLRFCLIKANPSKTRIHINPIEFY